MAMLPTSVSVTHERGNEYAVFVQDPRGHTSHVVTVWPSDLDRYAPYAEPEELIEAAFAFLLDREPPGAILPRFELPVIERYFPEFRNAMAARFA
jgi:hypothetical protein